MSDLQLNEAITSKWENGELGVSSATVEVVSAEVEAALDADLAMKLVTMRLPIPLIDALKEIAKFHGIAYQPMVRDLLMRFAQSEVKEIVATQARRLQEVSDRESSAPVEAFIERQRKVA